jgi:hypothetical protein
VMVKLFKLLPRLRTLTSMQPPALLITSMLMFPCGTGWGRVLQRRGRTGGSADTPCGWSPQGLLSSRGLSYHRVHKHGCRARGQWHVVRVEASLRKGSSAGVVE